MACYLGPGIDRTEGPTTKKVFKIQSDQFNYSRNVPEACELCGNIRPPGHKPYPVCVGCREARFCSKDHQVKHWPEHKAHCKERQRCHQQMRDTNARFAPLNDALGLPSLLERRQILEDWTEVHRHIIEQALVHAIYTRRPKVDLYREYVTFHVAYQTESNCNPSTAFKLHNSSIQPDPQDPLHGPGYRKFRTTMAEADAEMLRDDPGYVGACVTVFNIDGQYTWMTCTYLNAYIHDIPKFPRTTPVRRHEVEWYHVLKFFTDKGVVFRCVGPTVQFWLPGTLDRKGNKFVWRKRTMAELREMGIDFTCTLRRDADVRRIEARASWLH